jgi:molecular chaperone DnaK (HSP70)
MSYVVGIDLGTTQSVLSYKEKGSAEIHVLPIKQKIGQNLDGEALSLPSFAFLPLNENEWTLGVFAADQAAELPGRVIGSAKSWLTHPAVSPEMNHLPTGELEQKLSPISTLALFLSHLKASFEEQLEVSLQDQEVCITVPASFDPQAIHYIQKALEEARYPTVVFLEEPLASFYAWLSIHNESWRSFLKVGERVLVVDIGGGTTDFTLVIAEEQEGNLILKREKVGKHLLLGGDNLDMACAHFVQQKLGRTLDRKQFQSCLHVCRKAKEELLSGQETSTVYLPGSGSSLMGGALKTELTKNEISQLIVEGFFPLVNRGDLPQEGAQGGLSTLSLSYVKDPRVTAHLSSFLGEGALPEHVLFNGGTLYAKKIQERLLEQLQLWRGEECHVLPDADLSSSVAKGAVSYLELKESGGMRVRAGASRSYWIGIEPAGLPIPGFTPPMTARLLVPLGLEEGSEVLLQEPFSLVLGETKEFRFFCSEEVNGDVGTELQDPESQLRELPPIHSSMEGDEGTFALVKLKAHFSERGVLEVRCESEEGKSWVLSFDTRQEQQEPAFAS